MLDQDKSKEQLLEELAETRQREAQWRSMVANAPVFVALVDRAGTFQFLNRTTPGLASEDVIGKSVYDFVNPAYREIAKECIERAFDTGQTAFHESLGAGPNGTTSWYETYAGPLKIEDRIVAVTLVSNDITRRKRAEEALRLSEEHHRVLTETMLQGVVHHDADGTIIAMNPAAEHILGKAREQFLGSSSTGEEHDTIREDGSLFPGVEHPAMVALQTGEPVTGVVMGVFNPKVDAFRWISIDAVPLFRPGENRPYQVYAVFEDITKRKRADEALREREARLLEAQEVASLGFYFWDIAADRWTSSPVLDRILGISADYERSVGGWANLVHPDQRQEMLDHMLKEVVGKSTPCDREYRIVRNRDKQVRWVHGLGRLQFNADGQPVSMLGTIQDITERKQAEEELAKSRAMLQAAIDCLPFNFFAIGLDGRYTLQNAVSKAQQRADVIGKLPEEACPNKHDLAIWLDNNRRAFAGEKVEGEVTLSLGGEERSYFNVIAPISDGTQFYGILGVNIDITERKQAEEALKKAHDELELRVKERTAELEKANANLDIFRKFIEASGEGIGMGDFDGRIAYANPTLCRLLGEEKPEDVIGQSVFTYYPKDYEWRRQNELIPALLREGRWHIEQTMLPRHGEPIQTLQSAFLIRDENGNPFRVAVVISDITERKRTADALRASEERFRVAFEEAPVGIIMAVGDAILVRANRSFCQMSGYTEEELIGKTIPDITHPEDRARSEGLGKQVLAGVIPSFTMEKRYLRKGGGFFWGQATATAVHDRGGHIIFALGIVENITERKRAEAALHREHRNLKHLLQSSDHERQIIAYEIHDGLAQQLAGALMQFQAYVHLKDQMPGMAAKAFDAGTTMLRQGHYEARRLIAGVRPPILDEAGVVAAVGHLVNEQSRLKGPKIEYRSRVDFDRLAPTLENAIYRIAQEALTNACKHSKSERIAVSLLQHGDRIRIGVRDWGEGFDPKAMLGSRFGLEGIRQRARLLGGKCSIGSRAGKGTRISVELPVVLRDEEG